jgi:aquaporin Z
MVGLLGKMDAVSQVWPFWLAPIAGALLAGFLYSQFFAADSRAEMPMPN